jgi:hypothetical protein
MNSIMCIWIFLDLTRVYVSYFPEAMGNNNLSAYRSICFLNVIFKIFTKVISNRTIVVGGVSLIVKVLYQGDISFRWTFPF